MRNRSPLRSKFALGLLLAVALLHGATPLTNPRVRQLGELLECQCGCKASVTSCNMINCHSADPLRVELLALIEAGGSDDDILATMVSRHGQHLMRKPPSEGFYLLGWVMPYVGAAFGLAFIALVIKYSLRRRAAVAVASPGAEPHDPELARYKDRIEKDLAGFDS